MEENEDDKENVNNMENVDDSSDDSEPESVVPNKGDIRVTEPLSYGGGHIVPCHAKISEVKCLCSHHNNTALKFIKIYPCLILP